MKDLKDHLILKLSVLSISSQASSSKVAPLLRQDFHSEWPSTEARWIAFPPASRGQESHIRKEFHSMHQGAKELQLLVPLPEINPLSVYIYIKNKQKQIKGPDNRTSQLLPTIRN